MPLSLAELQGKSIQYRSGSGKTTLVKVILRLIDPSAGKAKVKEYQFTGCKFYNRCPLA
ncbi:MAG: ATP-binding cassette domain-containing protein [Caldilineaceae bacterium]